jgi:hypothetical protein
VPPQKAKHSAGALPASGDPATQSMTHCAYRMHPGTPLGSTIGSVAHAHHCALQFVVMHESQATDWV